MKRVASTVVLWLLLASATGWNPAAAELSPMEELGKLLFFDTNLSTPPGQSCATCHAPDVGFTGPDSDINAAGAVYPGAVHTRFGNRKPPTAAYGGESPVLFFDEAEELWIGGMFWDGRATGWTLGDPLAEQAQGPFLNPLEQNNPNARLFCIKVSQSAYAGLFEEVWGPGSLDFIGGVEEAYERVARSISAYEKSAEVNPFTSKYDYYLAGEVELTEEEAWGLELFDGDGMCNLCHISEPGPTGEPPLFTDFTYDNIGVPKNPENPFYTMPPKFNPDGIDWIDSGLGGFLSGAGFEEDDVEDNWGKHKVPTLRNVDMRPYPEFVKSFGHNGFFKSLEEIVHFYNTRDVEPWPDPEISENVNTDELGDLGLTLDEELAIVAFLKTLTDGYTPISEIVASGSTGLSLAFSGSNLVNPSPVFNYYLPEAGRVGLKVYDIEGRRVLTLIDGWEPAGEHKARLAGDDLVNGVYLARLTSGWQAAKTKVLLIR